MRIAPSLDPLRGVEVINGPISLGQEFTDGGGAVYGNGALRSIEGLSGLESIVSLYAAGNDALVSLAGLENVQVVYGSITLGSGPNKKRQESVANSLTSLDGLSSVTTIGGSLSITGEDGLTDLHGLEQLRTLQTLHLSDLARLENLDALHGLEAVRWVSIFDNPCLDEAEVDELVAAIGEQNIGSITRSGNGQDCAELGR